MQTRLKTAELKWLSVEEQAKVKIFGKVDGGYQRPIRPQSVREIKLEIENLNIDKFPPILIADVNGELQCVDGQNRLAGHRLANSPIRCYIRKLSQNAANDWFVELASKSVPVSQRHISEVVRTKKAETIRAFSCEFGMHFLQARELLRGLTGYKLSELTKPNGIEDFSEQEITAAETIAKIWCKDSRFIKIDRDTAESRAELQKYKSGIEIAFSNTITMFCLGSICKDDLSDLSKIRKDIRIIQSADWEKKGAKAIRNPRGVRAKTQVELLEHIKGRVLLPAYRKND